jgi:hypothetical protein
LPRAIPTADPDLWTYVSAGRSFRLDVDWSDDRRDPVHGTASRG